MRFASRWMHWLGGAGAGGDCRFALTRWFAVVGALAIGLFSIGMSWLLSSYLETRMLERDAAISRDFVQSIANIQQVAGFFRKPDNQPERQVAEFFAHVAAMPDVLRANIYAPDRRLVWSSRAELIGKTFPSNDELDEALQGRVVVSHDDEDSPTPKAEHQGLRRARRYVENYLPMFDENRKLLGVVELYREPDALFAAIESGQRLIRIGAAAGGLVLLLVLVLFVRRMERAQQQQQQQLVEAEALAIAGELSAAVAHSIRNPLGSIRSSAELRREIDGDCEGVYAEIMRNVDRIEHLVRMLLRDVGSSPDGSGEADLASALDDALQRFAPDMRGQGKRLEVTIAPDLGRVRVEPLVLAQVLNSLLANAVEATANGDHVSLSATRNADRAHIEVVDSGTGIGPEQLRNLFKPYYTTKPHGLGLGLALVRRIVHRIGGDIAIDTRPGAGTRVRLDLPVTPGTP